jgi:hypothetical protein
MVRPLAFLVLLSALVPVGAIAQSDLDPTPTLSGYVTRVSSPSDFDVNGLQVIHGPTTRTWQGSTDLSVPRISGGEAFFGEPVDLYGKIDRKKHQIEATKIVFRRFKPQVFSGFAVVDRILPASTPGELIVRADGYRIQIKASARVDYIDPLSSLAAIKPNIWIAYQGIQSPDGTIVADTARFQNNNVSDREGTLLKKNEYDPSKVPDDSKQNALNKHFLGLNPKRFLLTEIPLCRPG